MKAINLSTMMLMCFFWQGCSQNPMSAQMAADVASAGGGSAATGDPATLDNPYSAQAYAILQNRCASCHQAAPGSGGVYNILDVNHLVATGMVVPGSPSSSLLYDAIVKGRMPIGSAMPASEIQVIKLWIAGTAPAQGGGSSSTTTTTTIPSQQIPLQATFASIEKNILGPKCVVCHSASRPTKGYAYDSYKAVLKSVNTAKPSSSKLYRITQQGVMPPRPRAQLNSDELRLVLQWIESGAQNN